VPALEVDKVEIYVFRRRPRIEILALRRSPDRTLLPGVWQPVTGKLDPGERVLTAAAREVLEETGLRPERWWRLEAITLTFDPGRDRVVALPLFAAEVGARSRVSLSDEHDAFAFLSPVQAGRRFLWDSQRRGIESLKRQVLAGGALAKSLEIRPAANRRGRR
jgi:8-oxo-dGTP pyrophosphatase MutT (NUDIX family)